jgi:ComF family protein
MFTRILRAFKDSLFPNKCLACGLFFHPETGNRSKKIPLQEMIHDPIEHTFRRVMAPFLCLSCSTRFSPVSSPYCTQCGRTFKSRVGNSHQCGDCIQKKSHCAHVRSTGMYDGALMAVIHAFKYKHKIQLAGPLGRLLFSAFIQYDEIQTVDYVMPIPLHVSRLKNRGFNQAFLLIREWPHLIRAFHDGGESGNGAHSVFINHNCLIRKTKTISQTGLGKDQRAQNIKGAFRVTEPSLIFGKRILLVDDVYTTGATAEECARTLIASGATSVSVLTLARTD